MQFLRVICHKREDSIEKPVNFHALGIISIESTSGNSHQGPLVIQWSCSILNNGAESMSRIPLWVYYIMWKEWIFIDTKIFKQVPLY